jgi:hypothetical protein
MTVLETGATPGDQGVTDFFHLKKFSTARRVRTDPTETPARSCRNCGEPSKNSYHREFVLYDAEYVFENASMVGQLTKASVLIIGWIIAICFFGFQTGCEILLWVLMPPMCILTYYVLKGVSWFPARYIRHHGYIGLFSSKSPYADEIRPHPNNPKVNKLSWHLPTVPFVQRWNVFCLAMALPLIISAATVAYKVATTPGTQEKKPQVAEVWYLTTNLEASLSRGLINTELRIHNKPKGKYVNIGKQILPIQPQKLTRCDLTFLILFEDGTSLKLKRYWDDWDIDETKTITFPSNGKVKRISVTGVVHNASGELREKTNLSFTVNP